MSGNLTIPCRPEAAPQPQITWSQNGGEIGYGDLRRSVLLDGTLHVTEVTSGDQGRYTCKAVNSLGEAESAVVVTVQCTCQFKRVRATLNCFHEFE